MVSLTVRKLDERLKKQLRLRAARNSRSMEEEVRAILQGIVGKGDDIDLAAASQPRRSGGGAGQEGAASLPAVAKLFPGARVVLIIGGGIAAYKSLDLIRRLQERGARVRCILTAAAQHFVTALAAGALSGERAYTDLFDATSEFDVGHIRLARDTDLIVVAPATADLIAKMAHGHADDLAAAVLLATDKPILLAPAMNPHMWAAKPTQRNLAQLERDGVHVVGPNAGEMAERGEAGIGRMAEPVEIAAAAAALIGGDKPLAGKRVLVTSGPTAEPIDPVRFIANRSSGKQGHAIAAAAAAAGAEVVLISGPVNVPDPPGVSVVRVETAQQMLAAVERALPVDAAVFAAAVADWRPRRVSASKLKKQRGEVPTLELMENPDILATIAHRTSGRPQLVIGFAAETDDVLANAQAKLAKKGCDWVLANDVSPGSGVMGGDTNAVSLVSAAGVEAWPPQSKDDVARALVHCIAAALAETKP
jgi:phosphopantothenoylcysteine decarboxylase / phosphopantothenate---cysteine ligase